jgi:hypothetical protein
MKEVVLDVLWEGPFSWGEHASRIREEHVLYTLYGSHPQYGRDVLLYVGQSRSNVRRRLTQHAAWIRDEADTVQVRVASIGRFRSWDEWKSDTPYQRADQATVDAVEALLIAAHQPAYNSQNKAQIGRSAGIRVFNTGRSGSLLPEVSHRYWSGAVT